jgi:hypothetical protein
MAEPRSEQEEETLSEWCDKLAVLGADALVTAGLLKKEDFKRASEILAEELLVRLSLRDYPPDPAADEGSAHP